MFQNPLYERNQGSSLLTSNRIYQFTLSSNKYWTCGIYPESLQHKSLLYVTTNLSHNGKGVDIRITPSIRDCYLYIVKSQLLFYDLHCSYFTLDLYFCLEHLLMSHSFIYIPLPKNHYVVIGTQFMG